MTGVSVTCILMAEEGFRLSQVVAVILGAGAAGVLPVIYLAAPARSINRKTTLQKQ